jgi:lycopene cyclase domain-containing protein
MIGAISTGADWHYAGVLLASLAVTLPLEFVLGARVYRQPKRLITTIIVASMPFVIWDVAAIGAGHWSIADRFTLGLGIGSMPLEELGFFVVIPVCALLTFEVVRRHVVRDRDRP